MLWLPLLLVLAADDWVEYRSPQGDFTVSFPGKPEEQTMQQMGMTVHVVAADCKGTALMVQHTTMPSKPESLEDENKMLDGFQGGFLSSSKAKVTSQQGIAVNGAPGRELTMDMEGGQVSRARFILANGRVYILLVMFPNKDATSLPEADKFLNSFALINYSRPNLPATDPKNNTAYRLGHTLGGLCCWVVPLAALFIFYRWSKSGSKVS